MIYKVFIFLAFFSPRKKNNHCYHLLETEMLVFWAGLEASQDRVMIAGISVHLLQCHRSRGLPRSCTVPAQEESLPNFSYPQGAAGELRGLSQRHDSADALIPIL